jgi:hypothetical protein
MAKAMGRIRTVNVFQVAKRLLILTLVVSQFVSLTCATAWAEPIFESPDDNLSTLKTPVELLGETDAYQDCLVGEQDSSRTETTKTFRTESGSLVAAQYGQVIHFSTDEGETWQDINNELYLTDRGYENTASNTKVIIPTNLREGSVSIDNGTYPVSWSYDIIHERTVEDVLRDIFAPPTVPEEEQGLDTGDTVTDENTEALPDDDVTTEEQGSDEAANDNSEATLPDATIPESTEETAVDPDVPALPADETNEQSPTDRAIPFERNLRDRADALEGDERFTVLTALSDGGRYASISRGVDLEVSVTPMGIKENILLTDANRPTDYIISYDIGRLKATELDSHTIALVDLEDTIIYLIFAPVMTDAAWAFSDQVELTIIESSNGKLRVKLSADSEWIRSDDRVFPVSIYPWIIQKSKEQTGTFGYTKGSGGFTYQQGDIYCGREGTMGVCQMYMTV